MDATSTSLTQGFNDALATDTGSRPTISVNTLKVTNRTIASVNQAYSVCETMVNDWKKGILNAANITAKLQGQRPYNVKKLKDAQKEWKTNISTGFLATECARITPRFYMPLKTARYLTAASLPANWPEGPRKTEFFRETITNTIRAWPKYNFYIRGLAREVGIYGFAFNIFFDEYDWRPTLMRMDKGFVPQGTEIMESPVFFMAKYYYKPNELLDALKKNVDAGRSEWKKEAVVQAIVSSQPPPVDATYPNARTYEELVRQATWAYSYTKGVNLIATYHLFAQEATGKVSHYVILDSTQSTIPTIKAPDAQDGRLLYENLDQFESMDDAVNTMVFDYGDGTVHGSWGVGQILYDLAAQVEKVRCDSIDNLRMTNKVKINVPEAKNINDVRLVVNDSMMIVSGAQMAGNQAALPADVDGYEALDNKLSKIAQEKIGAFVPPIPIQPSDIKAAQINAAMSKEKELQEALLENWLIQWAILCRNITRRLCNPDSPDEIAKETRKKLLEKLTAEEISLLANEFPVRSVMDYTEYSAMKRAAFAASVVNNPLFRQGEVARVMASGVGDSAFVDSIVIPEGDQSEVLAAQRQQLMENAALALGQAVPVLPQDADWIHMQTMKPGIKAALEGNQVQMAEVAMQHYSGHYQQGLAKNAIPKDQINDEKGWITAVLKNIEARKQAAAVDQQRKQAEGSAMNVARRLVRGEVSPEQVEGLLAASPEGTVA